MICSICLEQINKEKHELKCGHCFHDECIETWLDKNDTCPYCRQHQNPVVVFHDDCKPEIITRDFVSQLILVMMSLSGHPYKILVDPAGCISIPELPRLPLE